MRWIFDFNRPPPSLDALSIYHCSYCMRPKPFILNQPLGSISCDLTNPGLPVGQSRVSGKTVNSLTPSKLGGDRLGLKASLSSFKGGGERLVGGGPEGDFWRHCSHHGFIIHLVGSAVLQLTSAGFFELHYVLLRPLRYYAAVGKLFPPGGLGVRVNFQSSIPESPRDCSALGL